MALLILTYLGCIAAGMVAGALLTDVTVGARLRRRIERAHGRAARQRQSLRSPW